jgi:hypothetical protein
MDVGMRDLKTNITAYLAEPTALYRFLSKRPLQVSGPERRGNQKNANQIVFGNYS